jgi:hypothetical protein
MGAARPREMSRCRRGGQGSDQKGGLYTTTRPSVRSSRGALIAGYPRETTCACLAIERHTSPSSRQTFV